MSKETAKKLIAELQTNEELKAKIKGLTEPAEMVKKAVGAGYDITVEEMLEAEKEYKAELAQRTDELTADELEAAAGGRYWESDISKKDGHEFDCVICYHDRDYQENNEQWCEGMHYCSRENISGCSKAHVSEID